MPGRRLSMLTSLLAVSLVMTQAAANGAPSTCDAFFKASYQIADQERLGNLLLYYACDKRMAVRPLHSEGRELCIEAYNQVKLGFVPGVTYADYIGLSAADRAVLNRIGFKRFKTWEAANSEPVRCLKEVTVPIN